MTFSERLDNLLKAHKVNWKTVYTTLHIGKNQKKYWADNDIVPEMETLKKLADYFNVSTDYLRGIDTLKEEMLISLDNQTLTLTAEEVQLVLKYRNLDKEGRIMVDSTLIQETRRMESDKGKNISAG